MILSFRIWDKIDKEIIHVDGIDFERKTVRTADVVVPFAECVLMQSTGLKDKNGVEIFEGDVVQYVDASYINGIFEDTFVNTGVVEFSQGMFTISNREAVEIDDLLDGSTWDVEVIGNIYENPELVEEEK